MSSYHMASLLIVVYIGHKCKNLLFLFLVIFFTVLMGQIINLLFSLLAYDMMFCGGHLIF